MSRWLQNVGTFLEKLDEGAAERAADVHVGEEEENALNVPEDVQLQSILTARGLSQNENDDEEEPEIVQEEMEESLPDTTTSRSVTMTQTTLDDKTTSTQQSATATDDTKQREFSTTVDKNESTTTKSGQNEVDQVSPRAHGAHESPTEMANRKEESNSKEEQQQQQQQSSSTGEKSDPTPNASTASPNESFTIVSGSSSDAMKSNATTTTTTSSPPSVEDVNAVSDALSLAPHPSHAALRESQKESRTLRRHVVSLNKQLEHAEAELQAQRVELERAAERLEKDRVRHKEDREKEKNRQADELKALKLQSEKTMKELKQRSDKQVEEVRKQLRDVEERRMQEGGDWNKELIDAVHREQEMALKYASLEDEKGTLLSQIAILQDQQEALGNRIESLSQTADNAMERERESETRLDEALNLHARQIAQRQARESELERTVSELGSALVAARSKAAANGGSAHYSQTTGQDASSQSPQVRLQTLEQEVDSLVAQLNFEKERCETLQTELRNVSRERTDEATSNHSQQIKQDRQVAEMSHTIARLESELRSGNYGDGRSAASTSSEQDDAKHLRELSEEVLRQREKIANSNSEISAMKSRLKVANERVKTAEAALEAADHGHGDWRDVERAPPSGNGSMRRRGGGSRSSRSRTQEESMRAALHLDSVRGKSSEQIGKALDGVDAFLVSSGRFLRYNALARLLFIAYLLILHIWTFVLIILHAHGFEAVHGDFGAGGGIGHGPQALMQEHVVPGLAHQASDAAAAVAAQIPEPVANAAGHS